MIRKDSFIKICKKGATAGERERKKTKCHKTNEAYTAAYFCRKAPKIINECHHKFT